MTDRKDFEEGLILGLCSPPLPRAARKPIAYSYNGTILPKLPEWDRERYPYAFIGHNFAMTTYLYVASEITHAYDDYGYWMVRGVRFFKYDSTADSWIESDGAESGQTLGRTDWANFDVLNEDGSVFMAASEPVPVYE